MRLRITETQARRRMTSILRLAQAGHRITLTRRGRPIAELGPAESSRLLTPEAALAGSALATAEKSIASAMLANDDMQIVGAMRQAMQCLGLKGPAQCRAWEASLADTARLAVEAFGSPADAARWLLQPAMGLNRQRPIGMLGTGDITGVTLFLRRLEYEVYT